jgi:hypothetical protein
MKMNAPFRLLLATVAGLAFPLAFAAGQTNSTGTDTGTFLVKEGAFPWTDRVNTWQLTNVPASVSGNGPLPQQSCGSRAIVVPPNTKYLIVGVCDKDLDKFKADYPGASATGDQIAVVHPDGTGLIPYTIFKVTSPGDSIGDKAFLAGLLILQVNDKSGDSSSSAPSTNASSAVPPPAATPTAVSPPFKPPQIPFDVGSDKTKLHIFVLMGQSNMVGRDTTGLESQTPDPRIGYFDGAHWIVAIEPMRGGSGFGPGTFFAKDMLPQFPDGKIGLVPCAVGGTPLSRWVKGGDLYENAVKKAKAAAASGVIEGVLWHQGESDSTKPEDATTYEARLTQMFRDLRQDLGQPDLPIVVGELGDFFKAPESDVVKGAIRDMPNALPRVGFADSNGLTHKGDHLHFNAASQKEFGQRYADAMERLRQQLTAQ